MPIFRLLLGVMFVFYAGRLWADAPSPQGSHRFAPAGALSAAERAADRFQHSLRDRIEFRDGIVYRNGRPWFLVGSQIGAGQWGQKQMFLPRVMGDNYVTISASPTRHFYQYQEDGRLVLAWERVPFVKSMANEAARNRLFAYLDMGCGVARNMPGLVERLRKIQPASAQQWLDQCSEYYGHYYPIDVNSELGLRFYQNAFASYLRYFERSDVPLVGVELFNELAVNAFTPQSLADFREYLRQKYGTIEKLNRVCRTRFESFDAAVPPFLLDAEVAAKVREQPFKLVWSFWTAALAQAIHQYPELWHDWVEHTRARFAKGFERLVKSMRDQYGASLPLTLQTREERVPTEGYQMVDIERIAPSLDFWGQQISNVLFYHYKGRPADPETVKEAMNRLTFYPDFGRAVCRRPIVNTECIVEGSFPAEQDAGNMLAHSIAPLETEWKYQTDAEDVGEKQHWFAADFDDSDWPAVLMPNLQRPNKAKTSRGRVWYRYAFQLDAKYQRLRDFDFKRFMLYLGELIPSGRIYLNGRLVFAGGGRGRDVLLDVSDRLNYGGSNTLVVSVDNPAGRGGLAGPLALVDADDLTTRQFIDAGQTAALFWQHVVHGHSGANFWQVKQPAINAEVIRTRLAIESVADVLLPRPRIRGQVAVLYPFESFRGIVRHMQDLSAFSEFMNVYAGLLFRQTPVDVVSCRGIIEGRHERYPLLVLPLAHMVRKGVFEQVLSYARKGGTLLITRDSLVCDDHFYKPLPLERLVGAEAAKAIREGGSEPASLVHRVGKGVVHYLGDVSDFTEVHVALGEVLAQAEVTPDASITFDKSHEFPFVEVQIIRQPPRFLIYLMNWGGTQQHGTLRLRGSFLGEEAGTYRIRNVRQAAQFGEGQYTATRLTAGIPVSVPPQEPLVLLVESEDTPALTLRRPAVERNERHRPARDPAPTAEARPGETFRSVSDRTSRDAARARQSGESCSGRFAGTGRLRRLRAVYVGAVAGRFAAILGGVYPRRLHGHVAAHRANTTRVLGLAPPISGRRRQSVRQRYDACWVERPQLRAERHLETLWNQHAQTLPTRPDSLASRSDKLRARRCARRCTDRRVSASDYPRHQRGPPPLCHACP